MAGNDSPPAPRSLQREILDRTWSALKNKGMDKTLIHKLSELGAEGRISHAAQVIAAIEESVANESS